MDTNGYSVVDVTAESDDFIPCLVVQSTPEELLPPPSTALESPLISVPHALTAISLRELSEEQTQDPWCRTIIEQIEKGDRPPKPPGLLLDESRVLCCAPSREDPDLPDRWVVPASLRERLCTLHHFARAAGHPCSSKMIENIGRHWYWPTLKRDCVSMVRRCPSCAALRLKRGPRRTYPLTIFPPDRPLEFVAMDVPGPLPKNTRGNQYVLFICDRFSKISVAVSMPDQTASTMAQVFIDRWVAVFEIPITVLTDNGPCLASKFFKVLTNIWG
jgi:Integrase zinc binding domain/Integrase core domain